MLNIDFWMFCAALLTAYLKQKNQRIQKVSGIFQLPEKLKEDEPTDSILINTSLFTLIGDVKTNPGLCNVTFDQNVRICSFAIEFLSIRKKNI